jgi:ComF family protein
MLVLLDILLPAPCVLCSKTGPAICSNCLDRLALQAVQIELGNLTGFRFSQYDEDSSIIVRAIKEAGFTALLPLLAKTMLLSWPFQDDVVLVPIPSSKANYRKRGFSHTDLFAKALKKYGTGITVANLLISSRDRLDQVNLDPRQRLENLNEAFRAVSSKTLKGRAILLDDVLTTGATMLEASRCLVQSGIEVAGFCVLAQTRPRKPTK